MIMTGGEFLSVTNEFGQYLRQLRKAHSPFISQEKLGELIGRDKMTISLIENGKNEPPQGELLTKIAAALDLDGNEKITLFDYAAIPRGVVPADILEYFNKHKELRNAIRRAQEKQLTDADWQKMIY